MQEKKPRTTATKHQLPYRELSPESFEKLCYWLIRREGFDDVEHVGAAGGEEGRDIVATKDGERWAFQCKRVESFARASAFREIEKVAGLPCSDQPDHYVFIVTCAISVKTRDAARDRCASEQFDCTFWAKTELDERVRRHSDIVDNFFGGGVRDIEDSVNDVGADVKEVLAIVQRSPFCTDGALVADQNEVLATDVEEARNQVKQRNFREALVLLERLRSQRWKGLDDIGRYHVLASLGIVYDALEDSSKAAQYLIDAKQYRPEHENARCLEATGYWIRGDAETAASLAKGTLRDFPESTLAAAILIRAAPESMSLCEVEGLVPASLLTDGEVAASLSARAMRFGDASAAERYARVAFQDSRDSPRIWAQVGDAILQRVTSEMEARLAREPTPPQAAHLEESRDHLTAAIGAQESYAPESTIAALLSSRGIANRILGNDLEAESDTESAYTKAPDEPTVAIRYALLQERRGNLDRAISTLKSVVEKADSADLDGLLSEFLLQRGSDPDVAEAIQLLERRVLNIEQENGFVRAQIIASLVGAYASSGHEGKAVQLLRRASPAQIPIAVALILRSRLAAHFGRHGAARHAIRRAFKNRHKIGVPAYLGRLAEELQSTEQFVEALEVWRELFDPNIRNSVAENLLVCAYRIRDDVVILETCGQLRESGIRKARYCLLESELLLQYGEYDKVIKLLQEAIEAENESPGKRRLRLKLAFVGLRLERAELIEQRLDLLPTTDEIDPSNLGEMVAVLRNGTRPTSAVEFAYTVLRRSSDRLESHLAVIASMLAPFGKATDLGTPLEVSLGVAVYYSVAHAVSTEFWIIEDEDDPDYTRREIPPDHPIAESLMGKRQGEKFICNPDHMVEIEATIKEIVPKYVARFRDSMESLSERFPEQSFMQKFSVAGEDNQVDPTVLLNVLDRRAEAIDRVHGLYRDNLVPLNFYCTCFGESVFTWTVRVASAKSVKLKCCTGTTDERDTTLAALERVHGIVIDPTAIATIFLIDKIDLLRQVEGLIVTTSTLEMLRGARASLSNCDGTIGKQDDKYIMGSSADKYWRANQEKCIGALDSILAILQQDAKVESANALLQMPYAERQELVKTYGIECAEALAAARGPRRILWTDDLALALMASRNQSVPRVWTQCMTQWLADHGRLDATTAIDVTLALVEHQYSFSFMFPEAFLRAALRSEWDADKPPLEAVVKYLCASELETQGLMLLVGHTLPLLCRHAAIEQRYDALVLRMLQSVSQRTKGVQVVQDIEHHLPTFFRLDVIGCARTRVLIRAWLDTRPPIIPG